MRSYVRNQLGKLIDYDAAEMMMDAEICEELHYMAPCSNQKFYNAYCEKHKEKYNEDFAPDVGLAW